MALEEVLECPVCSNKSFTDLVSCSDYTTSHETFHVKRCNNCGLGVTSPRPDVASSPSYYKSDQYISHTSTSRSVVDSIYLIIRCFTTRWKYRLIKPYLRQHGLLDYGCGTGTFLALVNKHGHAVAGIEPSPDARSQVHPDIPTASSLAQLPHTQFDAITLWHVLEHVYSPAETIRQLAALLTEHGTLLIAVPNRESHDASHYKEYWAAYDVPRHLWHFTPSSMATFLHHEGLQIQEIIPMKLDAYYVSLLSERYHKGSLGLAGMIRATWIGLKSNWKARVDNRYSSLIFLVTRK